jgi:hypothetical protein
MFIIVIHITDIIYMIYKSNANIKTFGPQYFPIIKIFSKFLINGINKPKTG